MALDDSILVRNHILSMLPAGAMAVLRPALTRVDLLVRDVLHNPDQPIETVYFIQDGYVSLLATLKDGDAAEVGLIGPEGMVGVPIVLGVSHSNLEAMVQANGTALRMEADTLRRVMEELPALRRSLLLYVAAFNAQITMTAACNGRHNIEQRLARWLLMAHDRTVGNQFVMTHEFLSTMLGVRRAGVTVAAGMLQKAGYIQYEQGRVRIVDRKGLQKAACECHARAVTESEQAKHYGRIRFCALNDPGTAW